MKVSSIAVVLALCLVGVWGQMPVYEQKTYTIHDGEGNPCATWSFAAKVLPEYMRNNSAERVTQEVIIPGPNDTEAYSVDYDKNLCPSEGVSKLTIYFSDQNVFTMTALSSDVEPGTKANANWTISMIEFKYNLADSVLFPDTADTGINTVFVNSPAGLGTDNEQGGLYQCNSPSFLKLNNTNNLEVDLELKEVLLNPYQEPADDVKYECAADASSSSDDKVVPIAVGCALGGLLLIVVIAFLIGRRSRRTGYKQV